MFEKIGRLAEGLATNVSTSRRGFLGRVGQAALGVAGALGALAVTASAQSGGVVCCKYHVARLIPYSGIRTTPFACPRVAPATPRDTYCDC